MALAWIIGIILLFAVFGGIFSTSTSPSKRPQMIVDQELGKSFLGLTKQELIAKLGNPKKVTAGSHPQDGKYEILTYDNSNENATLFTIWENDGYVSSGYYQGRYFYQKE